jgi:hypothetical protein
MFANKIYIALISTFLSLALWSQQVKAQLGPEILSPSQNGTVDAGKDVDIVYQYQNMGTGNYTIDVSLWQDAGVTSLIQNITTGESIPSGNSTGVQLSFMLNSTYTMKVPHGLNETFWLTVTETAVTEGFPKGISLRSRPVMLHTSGASMFLPATQTILLAISIITLSFTYLSF